VEYSPRPDAGTAELRVFLLVGIPLVLAIVIGGSFLTARPTPRKPTDPVLGGHIDYTSQPEKAQAEVNRLALSSRGDFFKLSVDDRRWLDSMSAGHGAQLIARRMSDLKHSSIKRAAKKVSKGGSFKQAGS
jgi:hypothetical protein